MPSLILSSRNTLDSQVLRKAAQDLGWTTLRIDGNEVPDWFEPPDEAIAFFVTAPHVFDLARQLKRTMLACPANWTIRLPATFLNRQMQQMTLAAALQLSKAAFIKHAVSKAFPAGIYDSLTLAEVTKDIPPATLVHISEPVCWLSEYRCFIRNGQVATLSLYQRLGQIFDGEAPLVGPHDELEAAQQFAELVLRTVSSPPAFVLDVGQIEGRGWAVVEFNECWASGIYACDPQQVLGTLVSACVPAGTNLEWDFEPVYRNACARED